MVIQDRDWALKVLATSRIIRAQWSHPGFSALVKKGWAKSLPVPKQASKRDFHITNRGELAARRMEK